MSDFAFEVFISYAHADVELARKLVYWLRDCGFRVWFAEEQLIPGTRFRAGLEQGLRESYHLVAVLTKSYLERSWTQREIDLFDLTADRTERRILAIQIGDFGGGSIDQVFQVHQRIPWNSADFDPAGFWLVYCGLSNQKPGPSNEWGKKGEQLLFKNNRATPQGSLSQPKVHELILSRPLESVHPATKELDDLVSHCLFDPYPTWRDSYSELQRVLARIDEDSIYDSTIFVPWSLGKAERASVVSLALLPQILKHSAVWTFIDLYCRDIAQWFLIAFSLQDNLASEMWFSWAISEQAWPLLATAANRVPDKRARKHFLHLSKMAMELDVSFKDAESNYDYGVMITPWNHFHLCWLAIKLGDMSAASSHAKALCNIAQHGDFRAGRFLTRLSNWPCFQPVISTNENSRQLDDARQALGLESLNKLIRAKQRIEEIWEGIIIKMKDLQPKPAPNNSFNRSG